MDKNEKYDKSCKNAMNVVMSKKNFFIQFVQKTLYQEVRLRRRINIQMSRRRQETERNQSFCMEDPVIGNHMNK